MGDGDGKKRVAIVIVAGLFLVAMVIGVAIGVKNADRGSSKGEISASRKAVDAICQPTDYKEICKRTLEKVAPDTDNPNELAKAAFKAAMDEINKIADHSKLLKQLEKDPKTARATQVCKDLFKDAADDFSRSMDEIGNFDLINMDEILSNVKIWLSATITYQETCLDGFDIENTTEAGMKVRKLLTNLMQMSSNGLAIVTGLQVELGDTHLSGGSRRLLGSAKPRRLMGWSDEFIMGHDEFVDDEILEEMARKTHRRRRLLDTSRDDVVPRWLGLDDRRRKLLHDKMTLDELTPNVTVAQDGSGNCTTIMEAIAQIPEKNKLYPFLIVIKEGVYVEQLVVEKKQRNVMIIGAGPTKTRISGSASNGTGTKTFETPTFAARGDNFIAKDIGFENTAGPDKNQAVAVRVQSDKSIFHNCHFDGYQDTLYPHTYRQYYRDCQISGTVDFVFGDGTIFFQNCTFVVRKPLPNQRCTVIAQGRKDRRQPSGIVIHNSNFIAAPDYFPTRFREKTYLGRPWKDCSKVIVMESNIDDLIQPDGWLRWNETDFGLVNSYIGEYRNHGPGAVMDRRVKWPGFKTILPPRAEKFMPPMYFDGDDWIKESGVPYTPALLSDSSTFVAAPNAIDEDPENAPFGSPTEDKDKDKNDDEDETKNKYKPKKDSKDKSSSSEKVPSPDSTGDSIGGSQAPTQGFGVPSESPLSMENLGIPPNQDSNSMGESSDAPSSEPWPSQDSSTIALTPGASISEAPSQAFGIPSGSPLPMVELGPPLLQYDQDETSDQTPVMQEEPPSANASSLANSIEREAMQEEVPTSAPSESPSSLLVNPTTPSESPSSLVNLERMLMQEESESPSPMVNFGKNVHMQEEPPMSESPSSLINLKNKLIMEDESPTSAPSESPSLMVKLERTLIQDTPPTNTPSEGPSSVVNLESMLMREEAPTTTPSESPSSSMFNLKKMLMQEETNTPTSTPSESPSLLVNLEKKLLQTNDDDEDASDDNDDHDRVVTTNAVEMDKILESLHLKTRVDLVQRPKSGPTTTPYSSPSPISTAMAPETATDAVSREIMESVSKAEAQASNDANNAQLAQLASSPQSKALANSMAQANQNGTSSNGVDTPQAAQLFQELGLDPASLPKTPPRDNAAQKKSDSNRGSKIQFRFTVVAVMMFVLFV